MVDFFTIRNKHYLYSRTNYIYSHSALIMGMAFIKSGIDMSSFKGLKFWEGESKDLGYTLKANEIANWMLTQPNMFGIVEVKKNATEKDYATKKGIIFFQDTWEVNGYIDIWEGRFRNFYAKDAFLNAKEVWFWPLI